MKKLTILIAIALSFGLGWIASSQFGEKPDKPSNQAKANGQGNGAKGGNKDGEKPNGAKKDEKAIPVAVAEISLGDISSSVTFNTSVASEQSLDIHAEIEGIIASIDVEEGDFVKAGDPLLNLANYDYRIQREESKANLDNLVKEFARAEAMAEQELITQEEFQTKGHELAQARLQFERDNLRYERSVVRAPFQGIVSERFVQTGARITAADPLFHIVNTNELIARVFIPEKLLDSIEIGQPVEIESGSLPDKEWKGEVKRISPVIDIETGTFKVTIAIEAAENLPAGLFVSARILTNTHQNAVLLPKQAIIYENESQYVYLLEDDKARKREIEPGIVDDLHVEALSAVNAGDMVIVQGQIGLKDETLVKVVGPAGDETKTAQSEGEEPEEEENAS